MRYVHADSVVLHPGDLYFGCGHSHIQTLLGSCVAVTLWHPARHLGGMCHFVVPTRGMASPYDGRYGDEALAFLIQRLREEGTLPGEYQVGIYGGGDMFPDVAFTGPRVGEQNVALARRLARECGLRVAHHDVGAPSYRQVILNLDDGTVRIRRNHVQPLKGA